jgi:hypothetical protein
MRRHSRTAERLFRQSQNIETPLRAESFTTDRASVTIGFSARGIFGGLECLSSWSGSSAAKV